MSLSPRNHPFLKLRAIAKRDLLTMIRGSMGLGFRFFFVLVELATFYFLARAVGPGYRPEGLDYFWFLLTGTAIFELLMGSAQGIIRGLRDAQISGLLEVLLSTSTSAALVIVLDSISTLVGRLLHAVIYIVMGMLVFRIAFPDPNWLATLVILMLSVVLSVSFGLVAASLQIWLQKGDSAIAVFAVLAGLFSGVLFAVDVLPPSLRFLADLNPLSHALSGFRAGFLRGAPWSELSPTILLLSAYSAFLVPLGLWLFNFALRRARRNGTLLFY
ncbi:MAG: ABC transporter permease [Terriglobales bacterium]